MLIEGSGDGKRQPDVVLDNGNIKLFCGDCLEILPTLEAGSVDAVVTDPPYGVNYKYDSAFDDTPEYWQTLKTVKHESLRICKTLLWFGASLTMQRDMNTLDPNRVLVWAPKFSLSGSRKDGVFFKWHPIYTWGLPKRQDGFARDVLDEATGGKNWWNHPATKPVPLMERLVKVAPSGGGVADPFMGSGTTGVACVKTGRKFIGIELDRGYFDIAVKRIEKVLEERDQCSTQTSTTTESGTTKTGQTTKRSTRNSSRQTASTQST